MLMTTSESRELNSMMTKDIQRYLKMLLMQTGQLRQPTKSQSMLVASTHTSKDKTNLPQQVVHLSKPTTVNMLPCKRRHKWIQTTLIIMLKDTNMAHQPRKVKRQSSNKGLTGLVVVVEVIMLV